MAYHGQAFFRGPRSEHIHHVLSSLLIPTRIILSGCPIDYPTLLTLLTGLQTGHPLEVLGIYCLHA